MQNPKPAHKPDAEKAAKPENKLSQPESKPADKKDAKKQS